MVVFTGKTVEEAIETGLESLNISRLKAHIKVISREKKGFLGFGKKPAQVDIEAIVERHDEESIVFDDVDASILEELQEQKETVQMTDDKLNGDKFDEVTTHEEVLIENPSKSHLTIVKTEPVEVAEEIDKEVVLEIEREDLEEDQENPPVISEAVASVTQYVQDIIYEMDIEASIEATNNRRYINLQIETPEPGRVIGYHGKVLKSLQLLAQNFLHDHFSRHYTISLNVHDYLEQRTEVLIEFTHKIANRVLDSGQDYSMDSMSNSERKIVHKTIATIDGVTSFSEGNDPNRYVVVTLSDNEEEN